MWYVHRTCQGKNMLSQAPSPPGTEGALRAAAAGTAPEPTGQATPRLHFGAADPSPFPSLAHRRLLASPRAARPRPRGGEAAGLCRVLLRCVGDGRSFPSLNPPCLSHQRQQDHPRRYTCRPLLLRLSVWLLLRPARRRRHHVPRRGARLSPVTMPSCSPPSPLSPGH